MESLVDFALQERYKQVKDLVDRLGELATLIEWEPFRGDCRGALHKYYRTGRATKYRCRPHDQITGTSVDVRVIRSGT
jgi:hypothetical protein